MADVELRALRRALQAKHPHLRFEICVLRADGWQTIACVGGRVDLSFVPQKAFGRRSCDYHIDEWGDRWSATVTGDGAEWRVVHHVDQDAPDVPAGARRWPQVGIQKEVARIWRTIARRAAYTSRPQQAQR